MEEKKAVKRRYFIRNLTDVNTATVGMAQHYHIQKNGEAASQILQAYTGKRYDSNGNEIIFKGRSLKKISEYKINPEYRQQNINQQAGFSAELIKEARDNKKAILSGSNTRTRTTDGLGKTNDQVEDHVLVDGAGTVIQDSGSQMKFLGVTKDGKYTVIEKIVKEKDWERYSTIDVPADQYSGALQYADEQAKKLREQAQKLREKGKIAEAVEKEKLAQKYKDAKTRIRKSNLTLQEAKDARLNPKEFVKKEVMTDSYNAGVEAAKSAMIMSGAISIAQNMYSVISEEKPINEAAEDVVKTTLASGAMAYIVGGSGTAIKAIMHSSNNIGVRRLGTTNAPAMIATASVEVTKSIGRYAKGDIDELALLQELGEKGTGMLATGFATAVGTIVAGPLGGIVGSMIGYNSGVMIYNGALAVLEGAKISRERRKVIEALAENAIAEMTQYKEELKSYTAQQYKHREEVYNQLFVSMEKSLMRNDINGYIAAIDDFGSFMGVKLSLNSREEMDAFMSNPNTVFVL